MSTVFYIWEKYMSLQSKASLNWTWADMNAALIIRVQQTKLNEAIAF